MFNISLIYKDSKDSNQRLKKREEENEIVWSDLYSITPCSLL
jgi:hypothetical protein